MRFKPGESFVESVVDAGAYAIGQRYLDRGFNVVKVTPIYEVVEPETSGEAKVVRVTLAVDEGNRNSGFNLSRFLETARCRIRSCGRSSDIAPRRSRCRSAKWGEGISNIEARYRDLGFPSVHVETSTVVLAMLPTCSSALLEGTQVFVDRIIVEGNERTSETVIQRELPHSPG